MGAKRLISMSDIRHDLAALNSQNGGVYVQKLKGWVHCVAFETSDPHGTRKKVESEGILFCIIKYILRS